MNEHKDLILYALRRLLTDDAERPMRAIGGLAPEQMEEHGRSGLTRTQVLAAYEDREADVNAAIAWVEGVGVAPEDPHATIHNNWRCVSMHDPDGRRGVWYQWDKATLTLTVRGGREGDDAVRTIYGADAVALEHVLSYGAWMQEEFGPNDPGL